MNLLMCPLDLSKNEPGTPNRDIVPLCTSLDLLHKASWKPLLEAWAKGRVRYKESLCLGVHREAGPSQTPCPLCLLGDMGCGGGRIFIFSGKPSVIVGETESGGGL